MIFTLFTLFTLSAYLVSVLSRILPASYAAMRAENVTLLADIVIIIMHTARGAQLSHRHPYLISVYYICKLQLCSKIYFCITHCFSQKLLTICPVPRCVPAWIWVRSTGAGPVARGHSWRPRADPQLPTAGHLSPPSWLSTSCPRPGHWTHWTQSCGDVTCYYCNVASPLRVTRLSRVMCDTKTMDQGKWPLHQ